MRPFAHANQAKVAVSVLVLRIKTASIISHAQLQSIGIEMEVDHNSLGACMFYRVVNRFLGNAQEIIFNRRWHRSESPGYLHRRLHFAIASLTPRGIVEGSRQVFVFEIL